MIGDRQAYTHPGLPCCESPMVKLEWKSEERVMMVKRDRRVRKLHAVAAVAAVVSGDWTGPARFKMPFSFSRRYVR